MTFLRRFLLIALLVLPLAALAMLWLAIEAKPRVTDTVAVSPADIDRALQLIRRNDPRGKLPGITRAMMLSQRDLELLTNQAGRRFGNTLARVRLQPGLARVQASLAVPATKLGQWLNVDLVLRETPNLPTVERLRLGRVRVPGWLAELALPHLMNAAHLGAQGELALRLVSHVGFGPQQMVLAYAWPDNADRDLAGSLLSPDDQARLKVYADRLVSLSAELGAAGVGSGPVSMAKLLPPMFALAQQRSPDAGVAKLENRAALVALAFFVNGQGFTALVPSARTWQPPRPMRVTLQARRDSPQHFLVSAVLAAEGGGPLADAIGLYKEVADSHGGTGFSFNDIAADRAGTRFGLLAVHQPQALQARLVSGVLDTELLPPIADLPESMPSAEFERRFGGFSAPAYRQMMADIEARLDRLPLLNAPR